MEARYSLEEPSAGGRRHGRLVRKPEPLLESLAQRSGLSLGWPDGSRLHCGADEPQFRCHLRSTRAVLALLLRHELRLGEAFLDGDIDLEGDLAAMLLRSFFNDISRMRHGVCWMMPTGEEVSPHESGQRA